MPTHYTLTAHDGVALIQLLNDATDGADRSILHKDLFLHYRAGNGWRVRFESSDPPDIKTWMATHATFSGLIDALRAEVVPVLTQLATPSRKRQTSKRPTQKTIAALRAKYGLPPKP
jgi:hypothetical protein